MENVQTSAPVTPAVIAPATTVALIAPYAAEGNANVTLIKSAEGKVLGHKVALGDTGMSFKDCRAAVRLADPALKGDKLTAKVNELFFGKTDVAHIRAQAFVAAMQSEGFVPNVATKRTKTGTLTWVKPGEAMSRGQKLDKALKALEGVELSAAQKAQLEALLDPSTEVPAINI